MNILITGGAGYIGSVLSENLLNKGHNVSVYDNLYYKQTSLLHLLNYHNFDFILGDIRDVNNLKYSMNNKDVIIHLACIVGAPACDRDPSVAESINLSAVKELCRIKSTDQLLIFPTTNSGYGTQSGEVYCTEETKMEPISLYGRLKVEAEKVVLNTCNSITFRLATVFGVSSRMRMDLLVNDFVYKSCSDNVIVLFEKHFKRNYVHIRDVANCFSFAIDNYSHMIGNAYNLGNDEENLSKEDMAFRIQKQISSLEIYYSELRKDPDKRNYIVSSEKLKNAGFEATITLDIGISELIKSYNIIGNLKLGNI